MDKLKTLTAILNPKEWLFTLLAAVASIAIVWFAWVQFKQYIAEPYLIELRVEHAAELGEAQAETATVKAEFAEYKDTAELLQKRAKINAKIKGDLNAIDVKAIQKDSEALRARLGSIEPELDRLRKLTDAAAGSGDSTGSVITRKLGDSLAKCERQVDQLHRDAADTIEIARKLGAAVNALTLQSPSGLASSGQDKEKPQ